jgi:peptide/nickel transport system permease protein
MSVKLEPAPLPERTLSTQHSALSTRLALSTRTIRRNPIGTLGAAMVLLVILVALLADVLAPFDPVSQIAPTLQPPGGAHVLGTDEFGRDVLSRVIHGARVSLYVGIVSVGIALVIGTLLGLVAGYYGGWADTLIMRVMDVLFGLPAIVLAIAITSVLGPSLNSALIAIGIVYAPQFGRVARAPTLSLRQRDFVTAARAVGAGDLWLVRHHIMPNMTAPVVVQATVAFSTAILTEATLSYLGLGTQPPTPSWGTMLNAGKQVVLLAPWTSIFPGLAVALTVLGFNLLGDGLRDVLDPRLR